MEKLCLMTPLLSCIVAVYAAEQPIVLQEKEHPLLVAAKNLDVAAVEKILKDNPDCKVDVRDAHGLTPLFWVVKPAYYGQRYGTVEEQQKQVALIGLFVARGATMQVIDSARHTMWHYAQEENQYHVLNALQDGRLARQVGEQGNFIRKRSDPRAIPVSPKKNGGEWYEH